MLIVSTIPSNNSQDVRIDTVIEITFDKPVDPQSVNESSIVLYEKFTSHSDITSLLKAPFLPTETDNIVQGTITINGNKITFKPNVTLKPNNKYECFISKYIKSTDGDNLLNTYKLSFTTVPADLVDPTPTEKPVSRILRRYIEFETNDPTKFEIVDINPINDSFLITSDRIVITFTKQLGSISVGDIKVKLHDVLSDLVVIDINNFNINTQGNTLTIQIPDILLETNKILEVTLLNTITSSDSQKLGKNIQLHYLTKLQPYYASTKLVRLLTGPLLSKTKDIAIALNLFISSLEAMEMSKFSTLSLRQIEIFRQKYALYNTILNILLNKDHTNLLVTSRKLSEVAITIDSRTALELHNNLLQHVKAKLNALRNMLISNTSVSSFSRKSNFKIGRSWIPNIGINTASNYQDWRILTWNDEFEELNTNEIQIPAEYD